MQNSDDSSEGITAFTGKVEESSNLMVSMLAQYLSTRCTIEDDDDLEDVCENVKRMLAEHLNEYVCGMEKL